MERVIVHSTDLASVGYDEATNTLEVQSVGRKGAPGPVYQYTNVPRGIWVELLRSHSKGEFFASAIKGKYPTSKVAV